MSESVVLRSKSRKFNSLWDIKLPRSYLQMKNGAVLFKVGMYFILTKDIKVAISMKYNRNSR